MWKEKDVQDISLKNQEQEGCKAHLPGEALGLHGLQQLRDHGSMAAQGGNVQRPLLGTVLGLRTGPCTQQQRCRPSLTLLAGQEERRAAVPVSWVQSCSQPQQLLHTPHCPQRMQQPNLQQFELVSHSHQSRY